ncbi:hypothetical protein Anapl_00027 [Anas platyrhynchos]|uniref:Uncharacterized protein n=1 Tax=Anas platyrhynchos TaxID=8839 RepID=R0LDY5_ANAPL|nr:hypothetical protein Anapl_00027 [Anas platyrhynchos]
MTRIDVEKMIEKGEYSKPLWKRLLMYKGNGEISALMGRFKYLVKKQEYEGRVMDEDNGTFRGRSGLRKPLGLPPGTFVSAPKMDTNMLFCFRGDQIHAQIFLLSCILRKACRHTFVRSRRLCQRDFDRATKELLVQTNSTSESTRVLQTLSGLRKSGTAPAHGWEWHFPVHTVNIVRAPAPPLGASLTAAKMIHWPRVSLLAPQQAPNSFLALQVQQKSPERATKAQQTAQLPCPASHQTHILPSQGDGTSSWAVGTQDLPFGLFGAISSTGTLSCMLPFRAFAPKCVLITQLRIEQIPLMFKHLRFALFIHEKGKKNKSLSSGLPFSWDI